MYVEGVSVVLKLGVVGLLLLLLVTWCRRPTQTLIGYPPTTQSTSHPSANLPVNPTTNQ